jgi:hypothetical protein
MLISPSKISGASVMPGSSASVGVPITAINCGVEVLENEEVGEVGYEADEAEPSEDKVEAAVRGWFARTASGRKAAIASKKRE